MALLRSSKYRPIALTYTCHPILLVPNRISSFWAFWSRRLCRCFDEYYFVACIMWLCTTLPFVAYKVCLVWNFKFSWWNWIWKNTEKVEFITHDHHLKVHWFTRQRNDTKFNIEYCGSKVRCSLYLELWWGSFHRYRPTASSSHHWKLWNIVQYQYALLLLIIQFHIIDTHLFDAVQTENLSIIYFWSSTIFKYASNVGKLPFHFFCRKFSWNFPETFRKYWKYWKYCKVCLYTPLVYFQYFSANLKTFN